MCTSPEQSALFNNIIHIVLRVIFSTIFLSSVALCNAIHLKLSSISGISCLKRGASEPLSASVEVDVEHERGD